MYYWPLDLRYDVEPAQTYQDRSPDICSERHDMFLPGRGRGATAEPPKRSSIEHIIAVSWNRYASAGPAVFAIT